MCHQRLGVYPGATVQCPTLASLEECPRFQNKWMMFDFNQVDSCGSFINDDLFSAETIELAVMGIWTMH